METNHPTDIVELETIERAGLTRKWEALERLKENPDFKIVVLDGYLKEKAIEFTSLLATDYVRRNNLRSTIFEQLAAISCFEEYLHMIENLGAPTSMLEDNEEIGG